MWGFEYVAAKTALDQLKPITLVFFKYLIAAITLFVIRFIQKRKLPLKRKHVLTLIVCSLFGEILYFWCEYSAMEYLQVSTISIILAFVPMVSIILEVFVNKRKPNAIIVSGIFVCIVGVILVIGVDTAALLSGSWIGYLLAFGAVLFWNGYNFVTEKLAGEYKAYDLTFMQLSCTVLLTLPYAIFNLPQLEDVDIGTVGGVLYLGIVSALIGFLIYVIGISVLGPTPCALYSNFLPITTAFFGWMFLGETLIPMQLVGGVIVIASGAVVIWQKSKLDKTHEQLEQNKA